MNKQNLIKRRKVISAIGLTPAWVPPIVESIILPAHAQTSSLCNFLNVSATISPSVGTYVDRAQLFTVTVEYSIAYAGTNLSILLEGEDDSNESVLVFGDLFGEFEGLPTSGSITIEFRSFIDEGGDEIAINGINIFLDAFDNDSGRFCEQETITIPVDLTIVRAP